MLANFAIGFNIPAADISRAKQFYAEKLGLTPVAELPTRVVYTSGGSSLMRWFLPWGDLFMMAKQLLTLKHLAERPARDEEKE